MSDIGVQIQVSQGVVRRYKGASFGGSYAFPATDTEAARIEITVWEKDSEESEVALHEGETFEIAGQTWRLDKIHSEGQRRWYADLTRIA
ncbi:MAG TPA: DUF6406 domain-containing protein [Streptosporangiaceae bacterium]|nr:DUF6406 domain-containing protein [Streptosporangiaceae bacterium]